MTNPVRIREIFQSSMLKCPHYVLLPDHYRDDGTCKCDDAEERAKMIEQWDYTEEDFANIPLRTK